MGLFDFVDKYGSGSTNNTSFVGPYNSGFYNTMSNYQGPIGPSSPGMAQGTANNVSLPSGGQVLGASTGGGGTTQQQPTQEQQTPQGPNQMQQYLDQQYAPIFENIDSMLGGLSGQKGNMETQVINAADQVGNTLTNTFDTNTKSLASNQSRNLNDLSEYLQSAWQQGNTMLGARGASDSSASNQYSYALAKQGSKQRGDIMQQTEQMQMNLKNAYDTEMQNNELEKQNKMLQVAQWFSEAQNQYKGMRAEIQAQKSQEALGYALQMVDQAQQVWANNKSTLDQWAANKATSLGQLTQMLNQNSANMPTFQGLNSNVSSGGGGADLFGFRNTEDQNRLI